MRKPMAVAGALILGGTLIASPSVANAAGCPNGLVYRVLGPPDRFVYELPRRHQEDIQGTLPGGTAVKGPGGSEDGSTPVTHYWNDGWKRLPTITTDWDIDWMSSAHLRYEKCAAS